MVQAEQASDCATVITGFNTDIEHDGVVYHVQTEDKGLETPFILSLVYSGGAILASKRAPYEDLIAQGFSDEALSERLKRQHKLICAAIHSGRLNDLKKMGRPEGPAVVAPVKVVPEEVEPFEVVVPEPVSVETVLVSVEAEVEPVSDEIEIDVAAISDEFEFEFSPATQEWAPPPPPPPPPVDPEPQVEETQPIPVIVQSPPSAHIPYTVHDPRRQHAVESMIPDSGLVITLLDDEEFYSAENRTLRVLVTNVSGADHKPLGNVAVSIKILGTAFRPQIYSIKTEKDGVASVATQIPEFTSGRAAVLVRAVSKDQAAELRRVIHPGK